MSDTKKPAAKISLFPVSAAIWAKSTPKGVFYTVSLERSYKDDAGKWQTTPHFNASDMLLVSKLADLVDSKVRELLAADRKAGKLDEDAA